MKERTTNPDPKSPKNKPKSNSNAWLFYSLHMIAFFSLFSLIIAQSVSNKRNIQKMNKYYNEQIVLQDSLNHIFTDTDKKLIKINRDLILDFGEWEKIPRLQAKTLV